MERVRGEFQGPMVVRRIEMRRDETPDLRLEIRRLEEHDTAENRADMVPLRKRLSSVQADLEMRESELVALMEEIEGSRLPHKRDLGPSGREPDSRHGGLDDT